MQEFLQAEHVVPAWTQKTAETTKQATTTSAGIWSGYGPIPSAANVPAVVPTVTTVTPIATAAQYAAIHASYGG